MRSRSAKAGRRAITRHSARDTLGGGARSSSICLRRASALENLIGEARDLSPMSPSPRSRSAGQSPMKHRMRGSMAFPKRFPTRQESDESKRSGHPFGGRPLVRAVCSGNLIAADSPRVIELGSCAATSCPARPIRPPSKPQISSCLDVCGASR